MDTITDKVRTALRIVNTGLDDEINTVVSAGQYDLERVGVVSSAIVDTDPTIAIALILYAKAQFDFDGKGERYQTAYEKMRDGLSLSGDYNV